MIINSFCIKVRTYGKRKVSLCGIKDQQYQLLACVIFATKVFFLLPDPVSIGSLDTCAEHLHTQTHMRLVMNRTAYTNVITKIWIARLRTGVN
jgi:hypothetical protein